MGKLLLDGGDAAGIFAADNIFYHLREHQIFFVYNFSILDNVDGNVVVDKGKHVKVKLIDVAFYF